MKRNKETDKSIMEFVKMTIDNPSLLDDSYKAKDLAKSILDENKKSSKKTNEKLKKDKA